MANGNQVSVLLSLHSTYIYWGPKLTSETGGSKWEKTSWFPQEAHWDSQPAPHPKSTSYLATQSLLSHRAMWLALFHEAEAGKRYPLAGCS